jgi:hypothetical protein
MLVPKPKQQYEPKTQKSDFASAASLHMILMLALNASENRAAEDVAA